jgi:hypothetical protein
MNTNVFFFLFLFPIFAVAQDSEKFAIHYQIEVRSCDLQASCGEFVRVGSGPKEAYVLLKKGFDKALNGGFQKLERFSVKKEGVPFKADFNIEHFLNNSYFISALLRSGPGTKREGKALRIRLKNLEEFREKKLTDLPIAFKEGTLQARLVFGP